MGRTIRSTWKKELSALETSQWIEGEYLRATKENPLSSGNYLNTYKQKK